MSFVYVTFIEMIMQNHRQMHLYFNTVQLFSKIDLYSAVGQFPVLIEKTL